MKSYKFLLTFDECYISPLTYLESEQKLPKLLQMTVLLLDWNTRSSVPTTQHFKIFYN